MLRGSWAWFGEEARACFLNEEILKNVEPKFNLVRLKILGYGEIKFSDLFQYLNSYGSIYMLVITKI